MEKLSSTTTSYEYIIFLLIGTYTRYPSWCCGISTKVPWKPFCAWWHIFNAFLSTCAVDLRTTHGQNNMRKCDTKCFIPVASLNGVVGLPYLFIRSLIGRTGKIWYVVYMNEKWTYTSETLAFTIRECSIVRNFLHVTFTCPLISWFSVAANVKWTPRVCHSSLKSVKVNCNLPSAENISKSHQPNLYIFSNLDWNISKLSITSSVGDFIRTIKIWNFWVCINT